MTRGATISGDPIGTRRKRRRRGAKGWVSQGIDIAFLTIIGCIALLFAIGTGIVLYAIAKPYLPLWRIFA